MLPIVEQVNHNLAQQRENLSDHEQKEAHRTMSHTCKNERTIAISMDVDQLSLDSSSKLTEETFTSSISSLAGRELLRVHESPIYTVP